MDENSVRFYACGPTVYGPAHIGNFRTALVNFLFAKSKNGHFMLRIDDTDNERSSKEYEDAISGANKTDMTKGRLVKSALRTLKMELSRANAPLIMTNHVYSEIGSMYPQEVMTGGKGPLFLSDVVLFLSKRKDKDGTVQVGNFISARARKSRFTKENSKVEI